MATALPPSTKSSRDRALALAAVGLVALSFGPHLCHSFDDAFITYRYARNMAQGNGMVFNQGVQILGTTAPGWATVLAVFGYVLGSEFIPYVSGCLALASLVGAAWIISGFVDVTGRRLDTFVPFCVVLACNRWLIEMLGYEEFAVTLLVLIGLSLMRQQKPIASGLVWSLGIFIRPDTAVMGAVAGLHEWFEFRRFPGRLFVSALLASVAAGLVIFLLSGDVVPNSLAVKKAEATASVLAVGPGFWRQSWVWYWRTWSWGGPVAIILAAAGLIWLVRNRLQPTLTIFLPAIAITVFYPLVGVPFAPWYLVYPVFCLLFAMAAFLARMLRTNAWAVRLCAVIAVVVSLLPQIGWMIQNRRVAPDPRQAHMAAAARWIDNQPGPEGSIAVVEAGFLGWESGRPILDLMGLNSPGALQALTSGRVAEFFVAESPAFFVFNMNFGYVFGELLTDPDFLEQYEIVHTIPATARHVVPVQIWQSSETDRKKSAGGPVEPSGSDHPP